MKIKDISKEPILYYVIVPVVLVLWPLSVKLVYLPQAEKNWGNEKENYTKSKAEMEKILKLDPDRIDFANSKDATEFDYTIAVDKAARKIRIPAASYLISSKPIRVSSGQKTQDCQITINEIDITRFAKFLSTLQLTWANLQCEKVTLTKKKGLPDAWKIDLALKYYY